MYNIHLFRYTSIKTYPILPPVMWTTNSSEVELGGDDWSSSPSITTGFPFRSEPEGFDDQSRDQLRIGKPPSFRSWRLRTTKSLILLKRFDLQKEISFLALRLRSKGLCSFHGCIHSTQKYIHAIFSWNSLCRRSCLVFYNYKGCRSKSGYNTSKIITLVKKPLVFWADSSIYSQGGFTEGPLNKISAVSKLLLR